MAFDKLPEISNTRLSILDGVYLIPTGERQWGYSGLSKINSDKQRFLSIVSRTGKTAINCREIKSPNDIRIAITEDLQIENLDNETLDKLRDYATGGTLKSDKCSYCKASSIYKDLEKKMRCKRCQTEHE